MEEVKFFPPPLQAGSEEMPHQTQAQMSGLGSGFQERDRFYFFKDYVEENLTWEAGAAEQNLSRED